MERNASDVRHDLTPEQARVLAKRIEQHMNRNKKQSKYDSAGKPANSYQLARLAQKVNHARNSGYAGSKREEKHCKAWNLTPDYSYKGR